MYCIKHVCFSYFLPVQYVLSASSRNTQQSTGHGGILHKVSFSGADYYAGNGLVIILQLYYRIVSHLFIYIMCLSSLQQKQGQWHGYNNTVHFVRKNCFDNPRTSDTNSSLENSKSLYTAVDLV